MATGEQCAVALHSLAARLAEVDPELRRRHSLDRIVGCTVTDLDICFQARVEDGELLELVEGDPDHAHVRLSLTSDDLLALVAGELSMSSALTSGRLRVEASMLDLLRLRSLF